MALSATFRGRAARSPFPPSAMGSPGAEELRLAALALLLPHAAPPAELIHRIELRIGAESRVRSRRRQAAAFLAGLLAGLALGLGASVLLGRG
jgi:hypothetical protein